MSAGRFELSAMKYLSKAFQIASAALSYLIFGVGAFLMGLFFQLLVYTRLVSHLSVQKAVRWCIHKGCFAFIELMRFLRLIRYSIDIESLRSASGGYIVVANHPSLIDIVFMFAFKRDLNCIVKKGIWDNVFTRYVVRLAGFIPNNSQYVVELAVEKLQLGENIVIFPEGTRTVCDGRLSFKRGFANIAIRSDAKILPVFIECEPRALQKNIPWYSIPEGGPVYQISSRQALNLSECIDVSLPRMIRYRLLTQYLVDYYAEWQGSKLTIND